MIGMRQAAVLLSIHEDPSRTGSAIADDLFEKTGKVKAASDIYQAIRSLLLLGLLEPDGEAASKYKGPKRKLYKLTEAGLAEAARLKLIAEGLKS